MQPDGDAARALQLRQLYDDEVRGTFLDHLPHGWTGRRDGPLAVCVTPRDGFVLFVDDAAGMDSAELVALVDRTVDFFAQRGLSFEWKTFDHDRPDLPALLLARGARAEEHESLVLGETRLLAGLPPSAAGLTVREVTQRADLEGIAALESQVWGDDESSLADELESRLASDEQIHVFVVADGPLVVSAGWLVPVPGTRVAGLWGGSTLDGYRGRGCYRALVAVRARLAAELGYPFLQVDASDDSRPILERLGLTVVGGTTPYKFASASLT